MTWSRRARGARFTFVLPSLAPQDLDPRHDPPRLAVEAGTHARRMLVRSERTFSETESAGRSGPALAGG